MNDLTKRNALIAAISCLLILLTLSGCGFEREYNDDIIIQKEQNNMKNNLYLKMIAITVCLSCLFLTVACSSSAELPNDSNNSSTNSTGNITDESLPLVTQPAPAIQKESMEDILDALRSSSAGDLQEVFGEAYQEMFTVLKEPGYIYQVMVSDDSTAVDAVTWFERDGKNMFFIMPYATLEDIGLISYVMYKGALYQVCIYSTDAASAEYAQDISAYLENRLECNILSEISVKGEKVSLSVFGEEDALKNCAASFIDDTHYYMVRTEADTDSLTDFLDVLSFGKMFIES